VHLTLAGFPRGLAFDSSGYLYMTIGGNIEKLDSGGNGTLFANSGLVNPDGIAFDSSGTLYVANNEAPGSIEKFDSSGNGSPFADSGLTNPMFIAFQVPEPATWSMLALGIGALLGGCRIRRR
jgi:hypothetical protein